MGYMRHNAILVTSYDEERIQTAHMQAIALQMNASEIGRTHVNGYCHFTILPDGSKEGWEDSDEGDRQRDAFVAWLDGQRLDDGVSPFAWAEVQYGDDEGKTLIVRHSDEEHRIDAANKN